jgi:LPS-assembly protein
MTKFPVILALLLSAATFVLPASAQDESGDIIEALSKVLPGLPEGQMYYDSAGATMYWTNGVYFRHPDPAGDVVVTANSASLNSKTGEIHADGNVRIESGGQLWVGEHIDYNFLTHRMSSQEFRTGAAPVFAGGRNLTGLVQSTNGVPTRMTATNAFFTTDDVADPLYRVKADRIVIIPGKKVQMWNAVFYVGRVPMFYFPYYERALGNRVNHFTFIPGYRSLYGAELLATYHWYLGDAADGEIHADYRSLRGPGVGPDVNLHLGQWGEASLKYYYLHDYKPDSDTNGLPGFGNIPHNRQMFYLGWQATPATNLNLKTLINYQSDPLVIHDFYPGDYTQNPQPSSFAEANKYWDNWSLDALTTPRVNSFFSQIERLPDVQLTGFRQQVFDTPVYYDSQSSVGAYRAYTANTTNNVFDPNIGFYTNSGARFDTFHQFTVPWTFFNWLNVTPNVGGRLSYYSESANGVTPSQHDLNREVLNTGIGFSFKASQLWAGATNSLLQVDGLRHIIEPSANYVFVPDPSVPPTQLPQFDGQLPSLMLLPVSFPDYNDIDSIDSENVIRFGLRNVLQTKRAGQVQDLVNWNLLLDWRLEPQPGQSSLNDLYSQLSFRPRTWLTFESQVRYDIDGANLNLAFHQITFNPDNRWSWGLGNWYLRAGTWGNGTWQESDYYTSIFFYRFNDNWGVRLQHNFDAVSGRLQSQFYTIYRDLRSWTMSLTFYLQNNLGQSVNYGVSYQLSLKASPSSTLGSDSVNPFFLVGQ